MNMMTATIAPPAMHPHMLRRMPPIALLRALPPGPMAASYGRMRRLADVFAAFDQDDMEAGVELLIAELDARAGDPDEDCCPAGDDDLSDFGRYGSPDSVSRMCGFIDRKAGDDDDAEYGGDELDAAWLERLNQTKRALPRCAAWECIAGVGTPEDAEPYGDEADGTNAEDEALTADAYHYASRGPGCLIADPDRDDGE